MHSERIARNGISVRELAARTGFSPSKIVRMTSEPRSEYLSRAQERRRKIRDLRAQGLSMRAIAAKVGCSIGTVHNALKAANSKA